MIRSVALGRVVGAHGIRGALRVRILGDGPENLMRAARVALATGREDGEAPEYEVAGASPGRPGEVRLMLVGVKDRDTAEAQTGRWVLGDEAHLEPLPPGEYYWYQLFGCRVEGDDGTAIGTVREIWEAAGRDVLVVERDDGRTVLLPAAGDILRDVDPRAGRIVIQVIPGLLEP